MKLLTEIFITVVCAGFGWLIGKGLAGVIYDAYKSTGDMVTASDNISINGVFPILLAIICGYVGNKLYTGK